MAARQAASAPLTSPAELDQMVRRAGLNLNAGQTADLALAWRQITELLGRIPREWKLVDDQAFVFRLPPPDAPAEPASSGKATARRAAAPKAKAPAPKTPRP
jgi:hypothetical protein